MTTIETSTFIRRSVADVFAFVGDQHNAVRWQRGLVEVRRTTDGAIGVGTRHSFIRQIMGRKMEAQNEYTAYVTNEKVSFKTVSGPMQLQATYLTVNSGEGTQLTCRMDLARGTGLSGWLHPLIVRSITKQMKADFASLKALLEEKG
jgi:hypothetical protein